MAGRDSEIPDSEGRHRQRYPCLEPTVGLDPSTTSSTAGDLPPGPPPTPQVRRPAETGKLLAPPTRDIQAPPPVRRDRSPGGWTAPDHGEPPASGLDREHPGPRRGPSGLNLRLRRGPEIRGASRCVDRGDGVWGRRAWADRSARPLQPESVFSEPPLSGSELSLVTKKSTSLIHGLFRARMIATVELIQ